MKKIYVLFTLMVLSLVQAQESFPFIRPALLKDTEVTVVDNKFSGTYGYFSEFYTDRDMKEHYMPVADFKSRSKREALLGRVFQVIDVDEQKEVEDQIVARVILRDKENNILYYRYRSGNDYEYPFKVIGGLKLPADFYCDYINAPGQSLDTGLYIQPGCHLLKQTGDNEVEYSLVCNMFSKTGGKAPEKVTLVLQNGAPLVVNAYVEVKVHSANSFKYSFSFLLYGKNLAAVRKNKIKTIKVDTASLDFNGTKLNGIIECSEKKTIKK